MKTKELLKEYYNESIIEKIYHNEIYFSEYMPDSKEYEKTVKILKKISNDITSNVNEGIKDKFVEYMENINIKESIEQEMNFKLGFKTAVKLIIEGWE